jgi:arginine decarboxylase
VPAVTIRQAEELYHVHSWGDGLFHINGKGNLALRPTGPDGTSVDLREATDAALAAGLGTPLVLRFPQLLVQRVDRLNRAFAQAFKDNDLPKVRYRGVFPVKVNQRREVVQALADAGRRWQYGLEVGSKAELVAALTMDPNRKSLLVVNGFKDRTFLEAACNATAFKDEVVIVLDEVGELPHVLPLLDDERRAPSLGIRLKLRAKSPGKWALSGGERAKFGLTVQEVLWAVDELKAAGHIDRLKVLHFHIGSQLSHIRRIAQGVREAARMYAELVRMGVPLRLLDVGGGLAVDYDGSGSSGPNSCNYTIEEYASTVVATVKDVCEEHGVPVPDIVSESGRAVVAHHAVMIVDIQRRIPALIPALEHSGPREDDPTPLWNLHEIEQALSAKTAFESFHDAVQIRDDLYTLFDLGHLDLRSLARADGLLRAVFLKIRRLLESEGETESEEYTQVRALLGQKLVGNFSVFQSVPDIWGVKQQFPILPLHRLRERPDEVATLADITCDSDGEIRQFIDTVGTRDELPIHSLQEGVPYFLAMCLVGAYQDSLGDYHNLFGETDEAFVVVEGDDWRITRTNVGSRVADMLEWVRYEPGDLRRRLKRRIRRLHEKGDLTGEEAADIEKRFLHLMASSTYLVSDDHS